MVHYVHFDGLVCLDTTYKKQIKMVDLFAIFVGVSKLLSLAQNIIIRLICINIYAIVYQAISTVISLYNNVVSKIINSLLVVIYTNKEGKKTVFFL